LFFALFWCLAILGLDATLFFDLQNSLVSQRWPTTTARVLESRLDVRDADDGKLYRPFIRYRYRIDGALLNGQRYRWSYTNFTARDAQLALSQLPVGKNFTLYYNPNNPSQSVINPHLSSQDLTALVFALPFNCAALLMLGVPWWTRHGACGFPLRRRGTQWHIASHHVSPLLVAVLAVLVLSFGCAFLNTALAAWVTPLVIKGEVMFFVLAAVTAAWKIGQSNQNQAAGIILETQPLQLWTADLGWIAESDLVDLMVVSETTVDSDGDRTVTYHLDLKLSSGEVQRLLAQVSQEQASKLRRWLSVHLNLEHSEIGRGI
jgi:hypothetical protein